MTLSSTLDITLGADVRARRIAQKITLADLGERIGVTYQQIQKYETGANRIAGSTLPLLAVALGCSVADLVACIEPVKEGGEPASSFDEALSFARTVFSLRIDQREAVVGIVRIIQDTSPPRTALRPAGQAAELAH